jgi:tetratricopeptide (TPR) repeat protein
MRTLVRFEKWDEILDGTTLPFYNKPREASWYYWARALASAARGNRSNALEALRDMDATLDRLKQLLSLVPAQLYVARAEADAALSADPAAIERVLALEADMLYTDPPTYPRPFLESAGRLALRSRDFKTAEARYRKLLEHEPGSGRALSGLAEALAGEGKTSEADSVRADFQKAWAHADSKP